MFNDKLQGRPEKRQILNNSLYLIIVLEKLFETKLKRSVTVQSGLQVYELNHVKTNENVLAFVSSTLFDDWSYTCIVEFTNYF